MYPIYIPSIERPDSEFLLKIKELKLEYFIILSKDQVNKYTKFHNIKHILVLPNKIKGISSIRQYILDYTIQKKEKKIWISDDDLKKFFFWSPLSKIKEVDFKQFLGQAEKEIKKQQTKNNNLVQVGFKYSTFAIPKSSLTFNTDLGMIHFLDLERLQRKVSYDPNMITLEDSDFIVQLIQKGFQNLKLNHFIFTAPRSGTGTGGLHSEYQNEAKQKGIIQFKKKYPSLIKIIDLEKGKYRIYWSKII